MEHREGTFRGAGGLEIYWQAWSNAAPPRAVIVLAHGASEHSGRYERVAAHLAPLGYPVYTLDHRGHGRSAGKRSLIDRMSNAVADLDAVVERARSEHPGKPVYMLGHSMGGCLSLAYTLEHQEKLAGLILSSPLAALEAASAAQRVAARVLSAVAPGLGIYEVEAGAVSRDPAEVELYDNDPLVYRGKLPVRTVAEIAAAIEGFPRRLGALTLPLLVMHAGADRLAPVKGTRMIDESVSSEDKTVTIYDGFFHELFNEPEADRERVLADLAGWLQART